MMMVLSEDEMEECTPLRVSFSHMTTKGDIDVFVNALKEISENLIIENTNVEHR